jgi:ABC-type uncharacterized transport system permease subunit
VEFSHFGALTAFICYLSATLAVVFRLFHPKGPHIVSVLTLGCIAIIAHTLNTANYLFNQDVINFSLPNVVSLVSLIITLTVTSLALRFKVNLLIPVTYAFAGLWQFIMVFMPQGSVAPIISADLSVLTHITFSLIAYCVLVIATLFAFQVAYINMKLKSKNIAAVSHLPPLMQVENQLFIILFIGTTCLLLSQLTGFLFLENFISKENAHKTVLSLLSLVCYFIILWGHFKQGWRGHKVLMMTIAATSLLTLAYFGSRFVKEFLL